MFENFQSDREWIESQARAYWRGRDAEREVCKKANKEWEPVQTAQGVFLEAWSHVYWSDHNKHVRHCLRETERWCQYFDKDTLPVILKLLGRDE